MVARCRALFRQSRTSPFETPPAAAPQDEVLAEAVPWPSGHQGKVTGI
ncbi:hypothetical protein [Brucella intermedia]|nr:hypothetical protein [Brucella intermedia]